MSDLSNYAENLLCTWFLTDNSATRPTSWYAALFTSAPSDAGGGVEVSGGGYARQAVSFGAPSSGQVSNDVLVEWTASGANFGNVVAVAVFDASSAGNMLFWKAISGQTVNDGMVARYEAGALTFRFD